ncbi:MAG: hypothetical protein R6U63_06505 [Longimicrobiales bacterium]
MNGRAEALWLKPEEYGPMRPVDELGVVAKTGIKGNADWGGKRQVTIIEKERWEAMMRERGAYGVVLDDGAIRVGDAAVLEPLAE